MADNFHQHKKKRRPKLWGVSLLEFFCTTNSYELAAIFPFLHNGRQFALRCKEV